MKQEIIQKAKQLGFISKFFNDKPYKYSNNEDLRYYLWLCELSLWLRDNYKIYLQPHLIAQFQLNQGWGYELCVNGNDSYDEDNAFDSQEQALEDGIFKSLKLILNK